MITNEFFHDDTYHSLVDNVFKTGRTKSDRTGTGTISTFAQQMRFDLNGGSIPLLTTKKIHTKSVIHEILWYLKGDTNVKYLNDNGVRIWNEWRKPYVLDRNIVCVTKKSSEYVPYSGIFSFAGIDAQKGSVDAKLVNVWVRMMKRCYDKEQDNYLFYGGDGVSVCQRWHTPANFIKDVKKIPHWYYKENDWNSFELDKDYYGAGFYSPETCVWVRSDENNMYTKATIPLKVITCDKEEMTFLSCTDAARALGLSNGSINRFVNSGLPKTLKGDNKKFKGYVFEKIKTSDEILLRYELIQDGELGKIYGHQWRHWDTPDGRHVDQIAKVVDQLRNNPDDRRIIVSAWNVGELDQMALPPCHAFFQFYSRELSRTERMVIEGSGHFDITHEILDMRGVPKRALSCHLYQRSCDVGLGLPFNIVQYSILTHMMAQVTGHVAEEFVWTGGDVHIYTNHVEQLKHQLELEAYPSPKLKINPDIKSIDDFSFDDFEIVDYKSHPTIKMPVAV